jgi:uncharacterized membrane-anchored protein
MLDSLLHDNGLKSRKWLLIIGAMLLITGVALLSGWLAPIQAIYSTFCGTIVSLCGLYIGGNGAIKYIFAKHTTEMAKDSKETPAKVEDKPKTTK